MTPVFLCVSDHYQQQHHYQMITTTITIYHQWSQSTNKISQNESIEKLSFDLVINKIEKEKRPTDQLTDRTSLYINGRVRRTTTINVLVISIHYSFNLTFKNSRKFMSISFFIY